MKLFRNLTRFDKLMAAVTFAEAGDAATSLRFLEKARGPEKQRRLRKKNETQPKARPRLRM